MYQHPISASHLQHQSDDVTALGFESSTYSDVDEQAAALTGWNQSYLQLSAGGFRGAMKRIDLGPVRIFMERLGSTVYQNGQLQNGVLALGFPLHCDGSSVFCGVQSRRDLLHVFSGHSGFEFRTGNGHVMLGLELDPEITHSFYPWACDALARQKAGMRATDPQAMENLRQLMLMIFETAHSAPAVFSLPALRTGMVDTLVERVTALNLAPSNAFDLQDVHWQLVQQARSWVYDQLHEAPTVGAVCLQLRVSRRTLQNAFQRILGVSPLAYLRAIRLGAVRKALKKASSVTEAATDMGFWHFGHFAKDYKAMFGELPSQTQKRYAPLPKLNLEGD